MEAKPKPYKRTKRGEEALSPSFMNKKVRSTCCSDPYPEGF
jgi:hypothetical protein